jgi:hypothetical protein
MPPRPVQGQCRPNRCHLRVSKGSWPSWELIGAGTNAIPKIWTEAEKEAIESKARALEKMLQLARHPRKAIWDRSSFLKTNKPLSILGQ